MNQSTLDSYFKVIEKKWLEIYTSNYGDLSHASSNLIDILRLLEINLVKEVEKLDVYQQEEHGAESSKHAFSKYLSAKAIGSWLVLILSLTKLTAICNQITIDIQNI